MRKRKEREGHHHSGALLEKHAGQPVSLARVLYRSVYPWQQRCTCVFAAFASSPIVMWRTFARLVVGCPSACGALTPLLAEA
jgi:hypothetical protein